MASKRGCSLDIAEFDGVRPCEDFHFDMINQLTYKSMAGKSRNCGKRDHLATVCEGAGKGTKGKTKTKTKDGHDKVCLCCGRKGHVKSQEMLADSLTMVMTMPKAHVARCGLKDLQTGLVALVMACNVVNATVEVKTSDQPPVMGFYWSEVLAAFLMFIIGLITGWMTCKSCCEKKTSLKKKLVDVGSQTDVAPTLTITQGFPSTVYPSQLYIAPAQGVRYHVRRDCGGLNTAGERREVGPCRVCCRSTLVG